MTSPCFKFYYLKLTARAESAYMMLAYANVNYEAVHVDFSDWPKLKSEFKLPSIVLPSGQVISQTGAIARYIARIAGFMPKTNEEIADCDQIFELAHEMNVINPITVFYPADSVEMAHGLKEFMLKLPHWLRGASKVLGNKQFFGGQDGPHYGDFHLLHVFLHVKSHNATFLDGHDTLKAWFERMCNLEKLQKYFQEQPRYGRPGSYITKQPPHEPTKVHFQLDVEEKS